MTTGDGPADGVGGTAGPDTAGPPDGGPSLPEQAADQARQVLDTVFSALQDGGRSVGAALRRLFGRGGGEEEGAAEETANVLMHAGDALADGAAVSFDAVLALL